MGERRRRGGSLFHVKHTDGNGPEKRRGCDAPSRFPRTGRRRGFSVPRKRRESGSLFCFPENRDRGAKAPIYRKKNRKKGRMHGAVRAKSAAEARKTPLGPRLVGGERRRPGKDG